MKTHSILGSKLVADSYNAFNRDWCSKAKGYHDWRNSEMGLLTGWLIGPLYKCRTCGAKKVGRYA